jgi:O-antigen/teichoic acid export membrane protein
VVSRTLQNTALILAARIVSRLLALVAVLVLIRHLGRAGVGSFQDVVNLSMLATVVLDAGFNTLFQREAARRPDQLSSYLSRLVTGRLGFALVALVVFTGLLTVTGKLQYLLPAFLMMVLASYSNLLRGALYAVQRLRFEALAIVLESIVLLGLVAYGVVTGQGLTYFLWAYALGYAFSCAYFAVVLTARRIARIRWSLDPVFLLKWLVQGLPFAATFAITAIYFKIDVPILDALKGDVQTGIYTAAYKPFEALLFLPVSMLNVVFPVLAVQHRSAEGRLAWAVGRFYKALLLLGWPIGIGTYMIGAALLQPIYYFPEAAAPLRILSLGIVFMFVSNAFIGALNAIDRQLTFTWAALGSMVVNIGLNVVLIPAFGYLGASWATVLTEVALTAFGWLLTARYLTRVPLLSLSWRILLAGLVMGAALYPFMGVHGPMTILLVLGGAVIYGLALLLLGAFDQDELRIARRALRL